MAETTQAGRPTAETRYVFAFDPAGGSGNWRDDFVVWLNQLPGDLFAVMPHPFNGASVVAITIVKNGKAGA